MKKYKYEKRALRDDSPDEIKKLFLDNVEYNLETGELSNRKTGTVYKGKHPKGYIHRIAIRFNNIEYQMASHRLAWYIATGEILGATQQIDHVNGDKSDNRLINLRRCSNQENQWNKSSWGSIPYRGVSMSNERGSVRYASTISIAGSSRKIGRFETPELAAKFHDAAARYYYREFAKPNFEEIFIEPMDIGALRELKKREFKHEQRLL